MAMLNNQRVISSPLVSLQVTNTNWRRTANIFPKIPTVSPKMFEAQAQPQAPSRWNAGTPPHASLSPSSIIPNRSFQVSALGSTQVTILCCWLCHRVSEKTAYPFDWKSLQKKKESNRQKSYLSYLSLSLGRSGGPKWSKTFMVPKKVRLQWTSAATRSPSLAEAMAPDLGSRMVDI